jgi:hypothetical protein
LLAIKAKFRRTWQSPSNAHAYRLYFVNDPSRFQQGINLIFFSHHAAISEALQYTSDFVLQSTYFKNISHFQSLSTAALQPSLPPLESSSILQRSLAVYNGFEPLVNALRYFYNLGALGGAFNLCRH